MVGPDILHSYKLSGNIYVTDVRTKPSSKDKEILSPNRAFNLLFLVLVFHMNHMYKVVIYAMKYTYRIYYYLIKNVKRV
jgi:hypothetical protein